MTRIHVQPPSALVDEPTAVRIDGISTDRSYALSLATTDHEGDRWLGRIELGEVHDSAIELGERFTELVGTMRRERAGLHSGFALDGFAPLAFEVELRAGDDSIATATFERRLIDPQIEVREVADGQLRGMLFSTPGVTAAPCVIDLAGSDGGVVTHRAALLASRGFAVFAPAYFAYKDRPPDCVAIPLEYFDDALAWLNRQDAIDSERLAVLGWSKGGELALILASLHPNIRAAISYVGSGLIWQGISRKQRTSSWTRGGEPLAYVPLKFGLGDILTMMWRMARRKPIAFGDKYTESLHRYADAAKAAEIAVEASQAAILLVSAGDDRVWPSTELSERVATRLRQHAYARPVEHLRCEGAGHVLSFPGLPPITGIGVHPKERFVVDTGGESVAHARAERVAWDRALALLRETSVRSP